MSLDVLLLEKLANWRPDSDRKTLDVSDASGGWSAAVTAECVDVVGCRLWELTLRRTTEAPSDELETRAEQFCQRVTGLLEPLRLVEVDAPRKLALCAASNRDSSATSVSITKCCSTATAAATVRRYQTPHAGEPRRQQVAFTLTHEALAKLVRDLDPVGSNV